MKTYEKITRKKGAVYTEMVNGIIEQIETGVLNCGEYLLPEIVLAQKYGISYMSVRNGLQKLVENGYIEKQPGKGSLIKKDCRKQVKNIALILAGLDSPYINGIANGIISYFEGQKYIVHVFDSKGNSENELLTLNYLLKSKFDGILIYSFITPESSSILNNLGEMKIPIILLDRKILGLNFPVVCLDNLKAGRLITSHLFDQGYKKISVLFNNAHLSSVNERLCGYRQVISERGQGLDGIEILMNYGENKSPEENKEWIREQIRKIVHDGISDAIIFEHDLYALYGLQELNTLGVKVPEEIGVAGFDDLPFSGSVTPSITTVKQNLLQFGKVASELIIEMIKSSNCHYGEKMIDVELKIRESTKKAKENAEAIAS